MDYNNRVNYFDNQVDFFFLAACIILKQTAHHNYVYAIVYVYKSTRFMSNFTQHGKGSFLFRIAHAQHVYYEDVDQVVFLDSLIPSPYFSRCSVRGYIVVFLVQQ